MLDLVPGELNFLKLHSINNKNRVLTYDMTCISVQLSKPQKRFEQPLEKLELRTELRV